MLLLGITIYMMYAWQMVIAVSEPT